MKVKSRALLIGIASLVLDGMPVWAMPRALHVKGTQVLDSRNRPVLLRGVNAASMEWSSDGEGHILQTVRTAIRDWHSNIIRLPLAQDRWFGKAPEQNGDYGQYRALVKQVVDECSARNCYIVLDLHWSDVGVWGQQVGQHIMPDENSIAFWRDCASAYRNNPAVLFDLYNEPHDTTWDIWLNGGQITEKNRRTGTESVYETPGMQAMLDAVRGTGARNVVVAGGLDWAYDFSGILAGRKLSDPHGNGVIYANHAYPFKGETVAQWITRMETATRELPVIVSEWGSGPQARGSLPARDWVRQVLDALHSHGLAWTAWDMHPSASPCLISDWSYTPTPYFGALVKEALSSPPSARAGG